MGPVHACGHTGFYRRVIVNEISPNYYAGLPDIKASFILQGVNFDMLPDDVIGVLASDNDRPTQYINSTNLRYFIDVVEEKSETMLSITQQAPHESTNMYYLGCLVDGQKNILWINETRPLP